MAILAYAGMSLNDLPRATFIGMIIVTVLVYQAVRAIRLIWFHPLSKYPGPWLAKVSPLYDFFVALGERRAQHFEYLHKRYGPIVRFGPNELSFISPTAFKEIYGFQANVRKADALVATQSDPETMSTLSDPYKKSALAKRKILSQGFSESALRSSEKYIIDQIKVLCRCLVDPKTERVKDMSLWLNYLAYDIMGEVVFGKGFDMLTQTSLRYILPLIDSMVFSMLLGGCLPALHTSNLINVLFPRIYRGRQKFIRLAEDRINQRLEEEGPREDGRKDFFYHLLRARDEKTGQPLSRARLLTEGVLLVTAGSDTTSTGLAGTLFYLVKHKRCMERLRKELDQNFENVDQIKTGARLTQCTYLRACVEEGLRMAPPGPGMSPRTILEGGQIIDGEYLPEGTTIGCATWALGYNPEYYPAPQEYRPERYLYGEGSSEEEVLRAKSSYWPFSTGVRKCPGVKMAYQELYLTIARLVYLFDMTPEKPEELVGNFDMLDHFNVKKYGPYLSFRLREGRWVEENEKPGT